MHKKIPNTWWKDRAPTKPPSGPFRIYTVIPTCSLNSELHSHVNFPLFDLGLLKMRSGEKIRNEHASVFIILSTSKEFCEDPTSAASEL